HGGGHALQDDEAGHRRLRRIQGAVRQVLEGGGQEAVPDSLFHRGPPGFDRRGHAESGPLAQEEQLPSRPGADLHADADGDGDEPKGRVIEVAPKRSVRAGDRPPPVRGERRNDRVPATTPFMAPPSKVKASILSTIKTKSKAGRK